MPSFEGWRNEIAQQQLDLRSTVVEPPAGGDVVA